MSLSKVIVILCLMFLAGCCSAADFQIAPEIKVIPPTLTVDKVQNTLTIFWPDTGKRMIQPVLLGKSHSNEFNQSNYDQPNKTGGITPAGTYPIKKMVSWRLNDNMLAFIEGKSTIMAIHPVWTGNPDQQRLQRLQSPTPDDNRITQGCINIDASFFYSVLDNLPDGTILTILPE